MPWRSTRANSRVARKRRHGGSPKEGLVEDEAATMKRVRERLSRLGVAGAVKSRAARHDLRERVVQRATALILERAVAGADPSGPPPKPDPEGRGRLRRRRSTRTHR